MPGAYLVALNLLASHELSESQLRTRLARRALDADDVESVIGRLKLDGTLNDHRVAVATARRESAVRHRGRVRVLQKLRQLGIEESVAVAAVDEVFGDVDEDALLDGALERRLRGRSVDTLDEKARAGLVRGLAAQGFRTGAILKRLRSAKLRVPDAGGIE